MGGGAYQFYAALKGLAVGVCSREGRQKAMVYIDEFHRVLRHKLRTEYTHKLGQHNIIGVMLRDERRYEAFKRRFGYILMRYQKERDIKALTDVLQGGMVADNALHVCA